MIVFPNAKINIGLNVIEKRPDGYHNIESIFYPIALKDILEIIPDEKLKEMNLVISGIELDHGLGNNLVQKAWQILHDNYGIPGCRALLHKTIPFGAGLGGGSADAAFCLKELVRMFNLEVDHRTLKKLAAQIGADCPFFIDNLPMLVTGIGDQLASLPLPLKGYYLVLIKPDIMVATKDAYAGIKPHKSNISLHALKALHISDWKNFVKNDFETTVFAKYPKIAKVKEFLYEKGAAYASMSGSGSSVYGLFEAKPYTHEWFPSTYFTYVEELK